MRRLLVIAACAFFACGPDHTYDRHVIVLGTGVYAYNPPSMYALRDSEIALTLENTTGEAHSLVLLDPDDGHTIATVDPVAPGQSASVLFHTPEGIGDKHYPFHCTIPGHTENGTLDVSASETRGSR